MALPDRQTPRRVAVLRALQLGDLLCAVPAFRALRAALPAAEIALIGLPWAGFMVERYDRYLDRFIELPGYPGLPERPPEPSRIPGFLSTVQRARFDLVIQMHGAGTITNPLAALLSARMTAGYHIPGQYCPDPERFIPYPDDLPEVCRHLRLLEHLGIPSRGDHLEFPLREADFAAIDAIEGVTELSPGDFVCIHPGAREAYRRWPPERFAVVADALARRGLRVVLTGSAEEADLTRAVASAMSGPALDLTGRTDLGALGALLSRARLMVSNDTGLSHLAAGLRLPSVIVTSCAEPERWAPLDRDRHRFLGRSGRMADVETTLAHAIELLDSSAASVAEPGQIVTGQNVRPAANDGANAQ